MRVCVLPLAHTHTKLPPFSELESRDVIPLAADEMLDLVLRLVHMAGDGALALHWSTRAGIGLNEGSIGAIGLVGGVITAWLRWKAHS